MTASRGGFGRSLPPLVLVGLAVAWVVAANSASWHQHTSSDEAWQALLGADILGGNWRLSGWTLTPYSSWTTEAPVYAAAIALHGFGPYLIHAVPVVLFGGIVVCAAWLAGCAAPGSSPWMARAGAALLIALPTPFLAHRLLLPGSHAGTALGGLLSIVCFALGVRGTRGWPFLGLLGAAVLAATITADALAVVAAAAPIVAACAVVALRGLQRLRMALMAALGLLATTVGQAARALPPGHGGFLYSGLEVRLVWLPHHPNNLRLLWEAMGALLGADGSMWSGVVGWGMVTALLLGGLTAAVIAAGRIARSPTSAVATWIDAVLILGVVSDVAAFVFSDRPQDLQSARYLVPAVLYGLVLVARWLPALAGAREPARTRQLIAGFALLLVIGARSAAFATVVVASTPPAPTHQVEEWLVAHGLSRGYAPYWAANITTVDSAGRVTALPIEVRDGRITRSAYLSKSSWYAGGNGPATFVLYQLGGGAARDPAADPADPANSGVNYAAAVHTFGPPFETANVGGYRVLVWRHDLTSGLSRQE